MIQRTIDRRQQIRAACKARGITIEQRGLAYHLHGPGVDMSVTDLALLDAKDLVPPRKRYEEN